MFFTTNVFFTGAVRLNTKTSSASDADMEEVVKTWLKYAKARFHARAKNQENNV